MKTILAVFIFLFTIAGLITLFIGTASNGFSSVPQCQTNQVPTTTNPCITPQNADVQQNNVQQQTNGITPQTTGFTCPTGMKGIFCQITCALYGGSSQTCRNAEIFGPVGPVDLGGGIAVAAPTTVTGTLSSQVTGALNHAIYGVTSNPLLTTLVVVGIFLGLGILAGTLGAGIKADVMAAVGIGLAVVTYIQTTLLKYFGDPGNPASGLANPVFFMFLAVEAPMLIFIIDEAFKGGKGVG
jgi:hypothetical protein